jgi:hypothetical protein
LIRINEDYSLLLARPEDQVIGYQTPDSDWVDFLRNHQIELPEHFSVHHQPFDTQEWLQEINENYSSRLTRSAHLETVGVSVLEEEMLTLFQLSSGDHSIRKEDFVYLNSKKRVVELCDEFKIPFPESFIENSLDLKFRKGFLLKSEYSSGGGGNLDLSNDDKMAAFFKRQIQENKACDWLWQKKHKRLKDWSYFGSTLDLKPNSVMQVQYDEFSLSYSHRAAKPEPELSQKFEETWNIVRNFLIQKNYHGPFGIDAFSSSSGEVFSLIDLNVRYTKSHFINIASRRFQLLPHQWICSRVRTQAKSISFKTWWSRLRQKFGLDDRGYNQQGFFVLPIQIGGLGGCESQTKVEVTILCGHADQEFENWNSEVYTYILNESFKS